MMSHSLCVLLFCLGVASAANYLSAPVSADDFNGTFLVFDVNTHKSSAGNIKTAINHLKNMEYAVKITGEERAFIVVRDDDNCDTLQTDFQGLQVNAFVARSRPDDITLNDTGLFVMVIESTLDGPTLMQALDDALERCGNCFKVFAVLGNKPFKCILIGNIPLDEIGDITNSTTADQCCDTVYAKRATNFKTLHQSCIDIHPVPIKQPVHKPIHIPVHKPLPVHPFPTVQYSAKRDNPLPVAPHKDPFPVHPKIDDTRFDNVKFPSIKPNDDYKTPNFASHFDFPPPHGKPDGGYNF